MRLRLLVPALLIAGGGVLQADLEQVKAESNEKKRSRLAMDYANEAVDQARDAYAKGDLAGANERLREVQAAVELTYESLRSVEKRPRKMAKHYKRAEIGCRDLTDRLESFRDEMSFLDRETIEQVLAFVHKTQDKLLRDVMGGGP